MARLFELTKIILISALVLVVVAIVVLKFEDYQNIVAKNTELSTQQIKNEAVQGCYAASVMSFGTKDSTYQEFNKKAYLSCLDDKGYESKLLEGAGE